MEISHSNRTEEDLSEEEIACIGTYLLLMTYPSLEPVQEHHIIRDRENETTD